MISTEVYVGGKWATKEFFVTNSFRVRQPHASKTYETWEDFDGLKYWAILNQEVDKSIGDSLERIMEYSQEDTNWIVETYRIDNKVSLTKYYPGYYPIIINEGSADLYTIEEYNTRVKLHHYLFGNPYKEAFFQGYSGVESLNESRQSKENRDKFYKEALNQHELFSDFTGCYFSDIDPNNFLVNSEYGDPKIIDIHSIRLGDIRDYVDHNNTSIRWQLPDYRIVGPVPSDKYFRRTYHTNRNTKEEVTDV